MSNKFPTTNISEFVMFIIMAFILYMCLYGVMYGGFELIMFLINWSR